jgi:hypothetical protein
MQCYTATAALDGTLSWGGFMTFLFVSVEETSFESNVFAFDGDVSIGL